MFGGAFVCRWVMSLLSMFHEDPFALTTELPNWDLEFLVENVDWELIEQYLEEDCDLTTLCMALNERDTRVKFVEKRSNRDSRIRGYERYEYGQFQ